MICSSRLAQGCTAAMLVLVLSACSSGADPVQSNPDSAASDSASNVATGSGSASSGSPPSVSGPINVFAAASLTNVFAEIADGFEEQYPEADVRLNLAGSSGLREQLREGAPADVFASASERIMDDVVALDLIAGPAQIFARNRLRIAVPAGNPGEVEGIDDFARDELFIGLCSEGVPCGELAQRALVANDVEASVDTFEPDVRALLTKVAADELDAGIVYATDIASREPDVIGIDIDGGETGSGDGGSEDAGVADEEPTGEAWEAEYPIAVIAEAPHALGASAFVDYVLGSEGQRLLGEAGFVAP